VGAEVRQFFAIEAPVCLAGRGASPPECYCRAGLKSVLAHFRCNRQAPAQVKPYALRHLPDRDGQVHDALFLGLLEQSQDPCYLTDGMFCSVFPAPNVRKNRFRLEIENDVGIASALARSDPPVLV